MSTRYLLKNTLNFTCLELIAAGYSRVTTNTSGFWSAGSFLLHHVTQNGAQHFQAHSTAENLVTSPHLAAREPGK